MSNQVWSLAELDSPLEPDALDQAWCYHQLYYYTQLPLILPILNKIDYAVGLWWVLLTIMAVGMESAYFFGLLS